MKSIKSGLVLAGCVITLAAQAGDWPTFFGDNARNAVSPETNLPAEFVPGTMHLDSTNAPKTTNLKWRAKFHTHAYGGPVIADGRIFIGTSNGKKAGLVSALDEDTGRTQRRRSSRRAGMRALISGAMPRLQASAIKIAHRLLARSSTSALRSLRWVNAWRNPVR